MAAKLLIKVVQGLLVAVKDLDESLRDESLELGERLTLVVAIIQVFAGGDGVAGEDPKIKL